jgi:hypothetical protein
MKKLLLFAVVLFMVGCSKNQSPNTATVTSSEREILANFSNVKTQIGDVQSQSLNASASKVKWAYAPLMLTVARWISPPLIQI